LKRILICRILFVFRVIFRRTDPKEFYLEKNIGVRYTGFMPSGVIFRQAKGNWEAFAGVIPKQDNFVINEPFGRVTRMGI